jgi:hypothetical protein
LRANKFIFVWSFLVSSIDIFTYTYLETSLECGVFGSLIPFLCIESCRNEYQSQAATRVKNMNEEDAASCRVGLIIN